MISKADVLLRSASWRMASETTVNPRPRSPARTASTAAFRASILVCSANSPTKSKMVWICIVFSRNPLISSVIYRRVGRIWLVTVEFYCFFSCPPYPLPWKKDLGRGHLWYDNQCFGSGGEQPSEVTGKVWCKSNAVPQL